MEKVKKMLSRTINDGLKVIILIISTLALCSCLGIEIKLFFNNNGSGRMVFQYKLSQLFKSLAKERDSQQILGLPISLLKEDYEKKLKNMTGVKIIKIDEWEDEENIYLKGEIEFNSFNLLAKSELFKNLEMEVSQEGNKFNFKQLITYGQLQTEPETLKFWENVFEGYEYSLIIETPRKIISFTDGKLTAEGKKLEYKIALPEVIKIKEKKELKVSW